MSYGFEDSRFVPMVLGSYSVTIFKAEFAIGFQFQSSAMYGDAETLHECISHVAMNGSDGVLVYKSVISD